MAQTFFDTIQSTTESFLTWRKRRKLRLKDKQRNKNQVLDWIEAFLSAVVIVFFINQYLFQAYQIPSESMVHTLEKEDRIFVDKLTFGPELLPGVMKFPGFRDVRRGDIIIFESPEYKSKGPVYDIVTRIVYMMTFSFIDLDRNEKGEQLVHFLVKRAIGFSGDRIRDNKGFAEIRPAGDSVFYPEAQLKKMMKLDNTLNARFYRPDQYDEFVSLPARIVRTERGIPVPPDIETDFLKYFIVNENPVTGKLEYQQKAPGNFDTYFFEKIWYRSLREIAPQEYVYRKEHLKRDIGRYIPEGFLLPMGDNRDNSKDGRAFGPILTKKVLGKSLLRFWPLYRFGGI
jgi:signal peptidase I